MKTAIVAGNYHQAVNYAREKQFTVNQWFFVDDADCLRGLTRVNVAFVGTWDANPEIRRIRDEVRLMEAMDRATVVQ